MIVVVNYGYSSLQARLASHSMRRVNSLVGNILQGGRIVKVVLHLLEFFRQVRRRQMNSTGERSPQQKGYHSGF